MPCRERQARTDWLFKVRLLSLREGNKSVLPVISNLLKKLIPRRKEKAIDQCTYVLPKTAESPCFCPCLLVQRVAQVADLLNKKSKQGQNIKIETKVFGVLSVSVRDFG